MLKLVKFVGVYCTMSRRKMNFLPANLKKAVKLYAKKFTPRKQQIKCSLNFKYFI